MNARIPASPDVLTEILGDATARIEEAQTIENIERECIGCFRVLDFALRHEHLSYETAQRGCDTILNKAEQAKRNMRARIEAARTGVTQVAA